jgi:hypothetical protein
MDPHYLDDFLDDDDYINDWDYQHAPSRAPVGGPVCQRPNEPIVIPGYTLDDQGVWQPPDDQPSSPTDLFMESVDDTISAEVLGLPGRLAERLERHQRGVNARLAHSLDDTFLNDRNTWSEAPERMSLPEEEGDSASPQFPPENPGRVAAEVSAVEHMLGTAIFWMSTVDISSVPPAVQERLASLSEQVLRTALRFPRTQEVLEGLTTLPESEVEHLGALPASSSNAPPVEAPSATTQRRRRRRPRRN